MKVLQVIFLVKPNNSIQIEKPHHSDVAFFL